MLIFGHRFIDSESFYHISNIEDISHTPPSSTIYILFEECNLDIIAYAKANDVNMALSVKNISQLMYASSLKARYIIVQKEMAKTAQNIAENYLFDAKILVKIENEEEIEEIALLGIDGVLLSNAVVKITS
ncbi:MAG: hypothetical protein QM497_02945 [Sulfurimonas sp.]